VTAAKIIERTNLA